MAKFLIGRNRYLYILILIIFVGIFLRIYNLGKQSIWLDEAGAYLRAQRTVSELWSGQIKESNPPLYDILFHFYLKATAKKDEFSVRLFPAIFGILFIPLVFIAGRHIFNRKVGLFCALLAAVSPYHIYYSQDAKMYTFFSALSLISFFLYYLSLEKNKIIYWAGYSVATISLIYSHNYGILLFLGQIAIYAFFYRKYPKNLFRVFLSQLIIISTFIPRISYLYYQLSIDQNPWILAPKPVDFFTTFMHFSLLSWHMPLTRNVIILLAVILPIYAFLLGMAIFARDKVADNNKYFSNYDKTVFLSCYLFIPLLLAFSLSFVQPIYLAGRYDMSVFPAFCLMIGFGWGKIKKRGLRNTLLAIIVISSFLYLPNYYSVFIKSNDRVIADYIQKNMDKEDVLIFTDSSLPPFRYYWKQDYTPKMFSFPLDYCVWLPREALDGKDEYIAGELSKLKDKLHPLVRKNNRLWVMYYNMKMNQRLIEELKKDYLLLDTVSFTTGSNKENQVTDIYIFQGK